MTSQREQRIARMEARIAAGTFTKATLVLLEEFRAMTDEDFDAQQQAAFLTAARMAKEVCK